MKQTTTNTALVLFSRTPDAEASVKNFVTGKQVKQNKIVAKAFYQRALKITNQTNLPVYLVDEYQQRGESFGEKLSNAIENVFQKGYQKVIVVGNDCLRLTSDLINNSADELNNNNIIIAPTRKGGVSLLGITRDSFNKRSFEAIPWQTSDVYSSLIDLASSQSNTIYHLPFLDDVNDYKDLIAETRQLNFSDTFRLLIICLFDFVKGHITYTICFSSCIAGYVSGLRAPPSIK